ncbi:unnamed protein product [Knipowitschia caucasica]
MPVSVSSGRRPPRQHDKKSNGVRHDRVQDTGLVNGTLYCDKMTDVYGSRTVDPTQAAKHNGIKPTSTVNGKGIYGSRHKSHETPPRKESQKTTDCCIALKESPAFNERPSQGTKPLSINICGPDSTKLEHVKETKVKRKKRKPKKRNDPVVPLGNVVPQSTEDWDDEIRHVKIRNWEDMSFGPQAYGPEDVVNFSLRDLSLENIKPPLWELTCHKYFPATHHQQPIIWKRYKTYSEPNQFSDVED